MRQVAVRGGAHAGGSDVGRGKLLFWLRLLQLLLLLLLPLLQLRNLGLLNQIGLLLVLIRFHVGLVIRKRAEIRPRQV